MQSESARQLGTLLEEAHAAHRAGGGGSGGGSGFLSDPVGAAETVGNAIRHNVPMPEEAADILKTVGKLK
ncbi:hypothetical protein JCM3766R1_004936, partial [Sporobolomyces carnicolor]